MDASSSTSGGAKAKMNETGTNDVNGQTVDDKTGSTAPAGPSPKTLTLHKNGITEFCFTDESINYVRPEHRKAGDATDHFVMGLRSSQWKGLLSLSRTVKEATKYNSITERDSIMATLAKLQKETLISDIEQPGQPADLLLLGSSPHKRFTENELIAVAAAASSTDVKLISGADGSDLGSGIFRLGPEFDHIEICVLPHRDPCSLYLDKVSTQFVKPYHRELLVVYRNVRSEQELFDLRNAMHSAVNPYNAVQLQYQDTASFSNVDSKSLWLYGIVPSKHGKTGRRACELIFTPLTPPGFFPVTLEGIGIPHSLKALHRWAVKFKNENLRSGLLKKDVLNRDLHMEHCDLNFSPSNRDPEKAAWRETQRQKSGKGKGYGKGQGGKGRGKGQGQGVRTFSAGFEKPIDRRQFALTGVMDSEGLASFVSLVTDGMVIELYHGGEYGFTFYDEPPKEGCIITKVLVNTGELSAHETWKAHLPQRVKRTDNFLMLQSAPMCSPTTVSQSLSTTAGSYKDRYAPIMDDSDMDVSPACFGTDESEEVVGLHLNSLSVVFGSVNFRPVDIDTIMGLVEGTTAELANLRNFTSERRAAYATDPTVNGVTITRDYMLAKYGARNPDGDPFCNLAEPGSHLPYSFMLVLADQRSKDIVLGLKSRFTTLGLCSVTEMSRVGGYGFRQAMTPKKIATILGSPVAESYWRYLTKMDYRTFAAIRKSDKKAFTGAPPYFTMAVFGKADAHLNHLLGHEGAETAGAHKSIDGIAAECLDGIRKTSTASLAGEAKKLHMAQKARLVAEEKVRVAELRNRWKRNMEAEKPDQDVTRQAQAQFVKDQLLQQAVKAEVQHEQALKLVQRMHKVYEEKQQIEKHVQHQPEERKQRKIRKKATSQATLSATAKAFNFADTDTVDLAAEKPTEDLTEDEEKQSEAAPTTAKTAKRKGSPVPSNDGQTTILDFTSNKRTAVESTEKGAASQTDTENVD